MVARKLTPRGLVLVSGQLDDDRLARAREALAQGRGPAHLAQAWSGKDKYGISGSMIAYVDQTYGRKTLVSLLDKTSAAGHNRATVPGQLGNMVEG